MVTKQAEFYVKLSTGQSAELILVVQTESSIAEL